MHIKCISNVVMFVIRSWKIPGNHVIEPWLPDPEECVTKWATNSRSSTYNKPDTAVKLSSHQWTKFKILCHEFLQLNQHGIFDSSTSDSDDDFVVHSFRKNSGPSVSLSNFACTYIRITQFYSIYVHMFAICGMSWQVTCRLLPTLYLLIHLSISVCRPFSIEVLS